MKGILVKYIHDDINIIINEILSGSTEHYRRLFEIPKEMEHVLQFVDIDFNYIKQPLFYPNLITLDKLLSSRGLDYAKNKLDNYI